MWVYFACIFVVTLIAAAIPIVNGLLSEHRMRARLRRIIDEADRTLRERDARLIEAPKNVCVFERGRAIPVAKKIEPDDA